MASPDRLKAVAELVRLRQGSAVNMECSLHAVQLTCSAVVMQCRQQVVQPTRSADHMQGS
jgi:hypothetical protein